MKIELSPAYVRARRTAESDILRQIVHQPSSAQEYVRLHVVPDEFLDPENKALFRILLSCVNHQSLDTTEVVKEAGADAEIMVGRLAYMITQRRLSYSPQEAAEAFWRIADSVPSTEPETRSHASWAAALSRRLARLQAIRDRGRPQFHEAAKRWQSLSPDNTPA